MGANPGAAGGGNIKFTRCRRPQAEKKSIRKKASISSFSSST
jgi:hypothetical protein